MRRLENPVRHYPWGSTGAIPHLLGREPDGRPHAELWVGAHPTGPSLLAEQRPGARLDEAIEARPQAMLGAQVAERFGARLPFLMKVLAAGMPLSLQVHPDAEQARAGFAAEEAAGVGRDSPLRRYRDPFHKPELLVALEPFEALCGFRPPAEPAAALGGVGGGVGGARRRAAGAAAAPPPPARPAPRGPPPPPPRGGGSSGPAPPGPPSCGR
jgi:mannose-6-phosphate isomerase